MPRNIEIKAHVKKDFEEFVSKVESIAGCTSEKLIQHDVFYDSPNGRLKLRAVKCQKYDKAQLIFYTRPDQDGPKLSDYHITPVQDVSSMMECLRSSMGVKGEVKKTRFLCIVGQTRVHMDQVEGLGNFMELEVVLRDDQTAEEGESIAHGLMKDLSIEKDDLCTGAYMDMLLAKD